MCRAARLNLKVKRACKGLFCSEHQLKGVTEAFGLPWRIKRYSAGALRAIFFNKKIQAYDLSCSMRLRRFFFDFVLYSRKKADFANLQNKNFLVHFQLFTIFYVFFLHNYFVYIN
jgi:hypothetical protein